MESCVAVGPISGKMMGYIFRWAGMSMKLSDQRVRLVSEILQGIRVIKMCTSSSLAFISYFPAIDCVRVPSLHEKMVGNKRCESE